MIVLKFGGTSVSSKESIATICHVVQKQITNSPIVVVSALKNVTNLLLSLPKLTKKEQDIILNQIQESHNTLINQVLSDNPDNTKYIHDTISIIRNLLNETDSFTPEKIDRLISYGEITSSYIVSQAMKEQNINSKQILSTELIITNNKFGKAECLINPTKKKTNGILNPLIEQRTVPVITGFIGATRKGKITTMGRGSSDCTASIIGYCMKADEIQIWTDVDGVLTADPKLVKEPKTLNKISYDAAEAFAVSGAKVLCPKMMRPAIKLKIPIRVLNTFNPNCKGTLIVDKTKLKINNNNFLGVALKKTANDKSEISLVGENLDPEILSEKVLRFLQTYKNRVRAHEQTNDRLCFLINTKISNNVAKLMYQKFIV